MASKTTYELEVKLGAKASSSWKTGLNQAKEGLSELNDWSNMIMAGIAADVTAAAATATLAISNAMETYTEFEQEMATVQSISGATATQFLEMKEAALEAGSSTVFTATEAASALEYMSLAGWDVDTSVEALIPLLQLAAATNAELSTTSDLVTDSMSALGLEVDDLNSYMDKLVMANNKSNTTAEQLMEALVKTGGASKTLGADLDDTITALGILANNGTKAEEAGTALNSIFTRIASNSTAIKELDNIGVSIFDESGSFIGLEESLIAINEAMADFTDEQKALSLGEIAGTQRYSMFSYLLDAVKEDEATGITAWNTLENSIAASNGALASMYDITTDTLLNAQKRLESAKEDMQIRVVDVFSDDAKEFVSWLAEKLPEVTESIVDFAESHRGEFADALETGGEALEALWEKGVSATEWLGKNNKMITGSLKGIAAGLIAIKTANLGVNLISLISSLALNPWGVAAVGALALGTAIGGIAGAIKDAEREMISSNLAEHFGTITLSLEELDSLARQIVGENSLGGIEAFLNATEDAADSLSKATDTLTELQKTHWEIEVGFNLSAADFEDYGSQLESYISQVEAYAEDKGYEVHLATSVLFGTGTEKDTAISQFFSDIQAELESHGNELYEYLYNTTNGALLDGIIDTPEEEIVQEYLAKINRITKAITDAENQAKFNAMTLKYSGVDLNSDSIMQLMEDLNQYTTEISEGAEQAYQSAMTAYYARWNLDNTYTQQEFTQDKEDARTAYYGQKTQAILSGMDYMMQTLNESYPMLEEWMQQYRSDVDDIIEKYTSEAYKADWESNPELMFSIVGTEMTEKLEAYSGGWDAKAMAELMDNMQPMVQQLEDTAKEYSMQGEIPAEITEALNSWEEIYSFVTGDAEEAFTDLANIWGDNEIYGGLVSQFGYELNESYAMMQREVDETYAQGFDVETTVRVKINPILSEASLTETELNSILGSRISVELEPVKGNNQNGKIASNAQGGIYYSPILTTFAEEGPEAAVPLDGSDRAKSLWMRAGQILGMLPEGNRDQMLLAGVSRSDRNGERNIQVSFNPTITIQGNAGKDDVRRALEISLDDLRAMLTELQREDNRVSFG